MSGAQTFDLRPGSVLYVPAGMWHQVEAGDEGSLSINFSIDGTRLVVHPNTHSLALSYPSTERSASASSQIPAVRVSFLIRSAAAVVLVARMFARPPCLRAELAIRTFISAPTPLPTHSSSPTGHTIAPRWSDVLLTRVAPLLWQLPGWRDRVQARGGRPAALEHFRGLLQSLSEQLSSLDAEDFLPASLFRSHRGHCLDMRSVTAAPAKSASNAAESSDITASTRFSINPLVVVLPESLSPPPSSSPSSPSSPSSSLYTIHHGFGQTGFDSDLSVQIKLTHTPRLHRAMEWILGRRSEMCSSSGSNTSSSSDTGDDGSSERGGSSGATIAAPHRAKISFAFTLQDLIKAVTETTNSGSSGSGDSDSGDNGDLVRLCRLLLHHGVLTLR